VTQRTCTAALLFYAALVGSLRAQSTNLGRIAFPVSAPAEAQKRFTRGVLLLHSFEYIEARREFQAARKMAPAFTMAYWGEAMTYNEPIWFAQDRAAARKALESLAPTRAERRQKAPTPREKGYLDAVEVLYGDGTKEERDFAYAAAMRSLHETYPDDEEAAAFYALSLLGTCHRGRDFRTYMQAAAIVEEIFATNSQHPGALHYLIHCYDDPVHAPLGLRAARRYAKIAPAAAHAQHMPSHIFFALGMWPEAAASNVDAWNASRDSPSAGGYHALWWLQYAYLQQGRFAEARTILQTIEQVAAAQPLPIVRFHLAQMRAMYSIETGEVYRGGVDTSGLDLPAIGADLLAKGTSALNHGSREGADNALASLRNVRQNASQHSTSQAAHHGQVYPGDKQVLQIVENELAALLRMADGRSKDAVELMKTAVSLEDKTPYEFGPPVPLKPAHELFGEILLNLGQPKVARVQFELSLIRAPGRALSLLGLARSLAQSGETAAAQRTYTELRKMWTAADPAIRKAVDDSLAKLKLEP
jgi:tetratricopeptide (TPR) repeat protein